MNRFSCTVFCALSILLVGCSLGSTPTKNNEGISSSESSLIATQNVSYIGTVQALSKSGDTNARYALLLLDGTTTLSLSPSDNALSLDFYIGKKIEARGSSVLQTNGAELLRVNEVILLSVPSSSSLSSSALTRKMCGGIAGIQCESGFTCVDDLQDSCDPDNGEADCSGLCVAVSETEESSSVSSAASVSSSNVSSSKSSSRSPVSSSRVSSSLLSSSIPSSVSSSISSSELSSSSKDQSAHINLMAKQKYESSLWTQKYCSLSIGFCVAAHKNWYFKSFGIQEGSLWHVEFGLMSIENIGDGTIALELKKGSSSQSNGVTKEVQVSGDKIVGFVDFGSNHFEVSAAPSLREAVLFMINSVTESSL
jgi:hypothetical protein